MKNNIKITVNPMFCPQNHPCPAVYYCPAGAMSQNGYDAPVIDEEKCTNCGRCTRACGLGAIRMQRAPQTA